MDGNRLCGTMYLPSAHQILLSRKVECVSLLGLFLMCLLQGVGVIKMSPLPFLNSSDVYYWKKSWTHVSVSFTRIHNAATCSASITHTRKHMRGRVKCILKMWNFPPAAVMMLVSSESIYSGPRTRFCPCRTSLLLLLLSGADGALLHISPD